MFTETVDDTNVNSERQEKSNEPCQNHDLVVPGDLAHDEISTDEACGDKQRSEDQRRGGDCEYRWSSIGNVPVGGYTRLGHGDEGDMG